MSNNGLGILFICWYFNKSFIYKQNAQIWNTYRPTEGKPAKTHINVTEIQQGHFAHFIVYWQEIPNMDLTTWTLALLFPPLCQISRKSVQPVAPAGPKSQNHRLSNFHTGAAAASNEHDIVCSLRRLKSVVSIFRSSMQSTLSEVGSQWLA